MSKQWSTSDIRALARATVDGRNAMSTARGAYFRALIETTQSELGGKADQAAQLAALKAVHKRFYPVVQDAIATDEILLKNGFTQKELGLERNRRLNFARSSYGTIKRWLKGSGHDIMKLTAAKTSKQQLLDQAPPARPHAMTRERLRKRADKLINQLVMFAKGLERAQAAALVNEATDRLLKQVIAAGVTPTTDASVAAQEGRPLRVGKAVFLPTVRTA